MFLFCQGSSIMLQMTFSAWVGLSPAKEINCDRGSLLGTSTVQTTHSAGRDCLCVCFDVITVMSEISPFLVTDKECYLSPNSCNHHVFVLRGNLSQPFFKVVHGILLAE